MYPKIPTSRTARLSAALCALLTAAGASAAEQGLSQQQVSTAMRPYMQAVRDCAARQHELDPKVSGRMDLSFSIAHTGRVSTVQVLTAEHARSYAAGCADGVLRSMKFPAFAGKPVVVPHLPIELGGAQTEAAPWDEDEPAKAEPIKEAPRKIRARVLARLKPAVGTMRACARDFAEPAGKRRRRRPRRPGPLTIRLTLNPLGRTTGVEVLDRRHRADHLAGCVAGVLALTEFPSLGSDSLRFSRVRLPRL